jgi:hypothetical protein
LVKHEHTTMHRKAERCKREEAQSQATGGIRACLAVGVTKKAKSDYVYMPHQRTGHAQYRFSVARSWKNPVQCNQACSSKDCYLS